MTAIKAQSHPEYIALLETVRCNPADDAPRLILSDWLEEQGEEERARFIRFQIKVARWDCTFAQTTEQPGWKHNCGTDDKGFWLCQPIRSKCREMFETHKCEWFGGSWAILYMEDEWEDADGQYEGLNKAFIGRGFISSVSLTCEAFVGGRQCEKCNGRTGHFCPEQTDQWYRCEVCGGTGRIEGVARELFSRHPITEVRLVDRNPYTDAWFQSGGWREGQYPESDIPKELMELMETAANWPVSRYIRFRTESSANAALSRACVAYGRNLVGLPMLDS